MSLVLVEVGLGHVLSLDVDAANGTALVEREPLIDAGHVEQMHAGQTSHVFVLVELAKANRAFVHFVVVTFVFFVFLAFIRIRPDDFLELMRKRVPLDATSAGAAVVGRPAEAFVGAALLDQPEVVFCGCGSVSHGLQKQRHVYSVLAEVRIMRVRRAGYCGLTVGMMRMVRKRTDHNVGHVCGARSRSDGSRSRVRRPQRERMGEMSWQRRRIGASRGHVPPHQLLLVLVGVPQSLVSGMHDRFPPPIVVIIRVRNLRL